MDKKVSNEDINSTSLRLNDDEDDSSIFGFGDSDELDEGADIDDGDAIEDEEIDLDNIESDSLGDIDDIDNLARSANIDVNSEEEGTGDYSVPTDYFTDDNGRTFDTSGREVGFDDNGNPYYLDELEEADESEGESDSEGLESEDELSESYEDKDWNFNGLGESESGSDLESDELSESDGLEAGTDEGFNESEVDDEGYSNIENEVSEDAEAETESSESESDESDDVNNIADESNSSFLDSDGNLSVMNKGSVEDTFDLKILPFDRISVSKRVRSGVNVEDLLQSIKSTGLLNPIVVAPTATEGMYVLIDGYRRIIACAKAGITDVPAIVNNKIKTAEIPIVEAMYNHKKQYTMRDIVDYIEYLEKEKNITNPSLIEFLMELDNGDYNKLKDILSDDDEDIVTKMMNGQMTIGQAFKQLEKRRSKESKEEKDLKKAAKVYGDTEESGADAIEETGETGDEGSALTDEQIQSLAIDPTQLDSDSDNISLADAAKEADDTPGYEAHKQKVGEREYIDPAIKKAVMARDGSVCQCCKKGGSQFVDILDYHHILPVYLGGKDTVENGIMLCVACHRLVHLHGTGDLHIDPELLKDNYDDISDKAKELYKSEELFKDEQRRFKRIIHLGSVIRNGAAMKGMNREKFKKEHPNTGIGRRKPGKNAPQEQA